MVDGALQGVIARAQEGDRAHWVAIADRGAAFERERLAQLVGVAGRESARLAPPSECGAALCTWNTPRGRIAGLARDGAALEQLCEPGAIVIAEVKPPAGWRARCKPAALISPPTLAANGGAAIYETEKGIAVARARVAGHARAWDGALTDSAE